MIRYTRFQTSLCEVILAGTEAGLRYSHMVTGVGREFPIGPDWIRDDNFFSDAARQIREFAQGERREFSLALDLRGTEFQIRVWNALQQIPYGETRTYGEIAGAVGCPRGGRAVGLANNKNPLPIIVPCHRVVGARGQLTGFAHGLEFKAKLLEFESKQRGLF